MIRPRNSRPLPRPVRVFPADGGYHPDRGGGPGAGGPGGGTTFTRLDGSRGRSPDWAYGVTTFRPTPTQERAGVPYRRGTTLPRTLASLAGAGFPSPTLFVDGDHDWRGWTDEFKLDIVCRYPVIRAFGNWILALAELMVRKPYVDYYAIFQDDVIFSKNLKSYVEAGYPVDGYLNLYTFPKNQAMSNGHLGWYRSNQKGLGALALVFNRTAAVTLLSQPSTVKKPVTADPQRRHKFIDGGIVTAMREAGFWEYVHNPSLCQHIGTDSTLANPDHPRATSFRGEQYDATVLLDGGR